MRLRNLVLSSLAFSMIPSAPFALAQTYPDALYDGMVAWWKADGDVNDSIGDHDGINPTDISYADGVDGQAFLFVHGQSTDDVIVPNQSDLDFGIGGDLTAVTFDLWVMPSNFPIPNGWYHVFGKRLGCIDNFIDYQFVLGTSSGSAFYAALGGFPGTGVGIDLEPGDVVIGEWTHFAASFDSAFNSWRLYVNGEPRVNTGSGALGALNEAPALVIGGSGSCGGGWEGRLDNLRIWNRQLSDEEVYEAYLFISETTNQPPVAVCDPEAITLEAEGPGGALATLDGSGSFDPDGDPLTFHWDVSDVDVLLDNPDSATPTGIFPIGNTLATLTVTDGNGGFDTCDVSVMVLDTTPPEVICTSDFAVLWPPNHTMRTVRLMVTTIDLASNPQDITILSMTVRSDEPDDAEGFGDGATTGDVNGFDGYTSPVSVMPILWFDPTAGQNGSWVADIQLRAERDGDGDGRCYTIDVVAIDASNNESRTSCCIVVPHDRRNR